MLNNVKKCWTISDNRFFNIALFFGTSQLSRIITVSSFIDINFLLWQSINLSKHLQHHQYYRLFNHCTSQLNPNVVASISSYLSFHCLGVLQSRHHFNPEAWKCRKPNQMLHHNSFSVCLLSVSPRLASPRLDSPRSITQSQGNQNGTESGRVEAKEHSKGQQS